MAAVVCLLQERRTRFAVVGAAAMAVHGVSRSTRDVDLFTLATECLAAAFWTPLTATRIEASIRPGDVDDPLVGVVRVRRKGDHPVDVVVGKSAW